MKWKDTPGILALLTVSYLLIYQATGELNPIRISKESFRDRRAYVKTMNQERAYKGELIYSLFGKNGLADTDDDGLISPRETLEAYNRMGINDDDISIGFRKFLAPDILTSDLERAIESYNQ